jgi:putative DNA primase/helicase
MPDGLHLHDVIAEFRDAFVDAGPVPPAEIIADGEWHRCDVAGKRPRNDDGGYLLHPDGWPTGLLHNFVEGRRVRWHPNTRGRKVTKADRDDAKRKIEAANARRETAQEKVAAIAEYVVVNYPDCIENEYLTRKRVGSYGLKTTKVAINVLYLPLRDIDGKIWSLQTIFGDGRKDFDFGGRKAGCFHTIGELVDGRPIQIAEATQPPRHVTKRTASPASSGSTPAT